MLAHAREKGARGEPQGIAALVLRRVEEHGEFPAMAQTVLRVNGITSNEASSAAQLANAILDDFALTKSVLRVVNSAIYHQSIEVTTVSRAIVVLGWNSIRSLVLALKLFDSIPKSADRELVKQRLGAAFCGGMLAKNVALSSSPGLEEEGFICTLFHSFGELLVTFYLPEKIREIDQAVATRRVKEGAAVRAVLGMTFAEIGAAVARKLHFPEAIVECMAPNLQPPRGPIGKQDRLVGLALLGSNMAKIILEEGGEASGRSRLEALLAGYHKRYGGPGVELERVVSATMKDFESHANILGLPIAPRELVRRMGAAVSQEAKPESGRTGLAEADVPAPPSREEPDTIFARGIQEATRCLMGQASLNEVVLVVLETMFRGLEQHRASRAVFLIKDPARPILSFRSGLGRGLEDAKRWLEIDLSSERDVFSRALVNNEVLHFQDLRAARRAGALPSWVASKVAPEAYLVLLPILVKGRPIGFFYVEGDAGVPVPEKHVNYLAILRDQVVISILECVRSGRGM